MTGARRLAGVLGVAALVASASACAAETVVPTETSCDVGSPEVLAAQTVPTAAAVPCIGDLDEWRPGSTEFTDDGSEIDLVTRDDDASWRVVFAETCETGDVAAEPWEGDVEADIHRTVDEDGGRYRVSTAIVFDGGCVTSELDVPDDRLRPAIVEESEEALELLPRSVVSAHVERTTEGRLQLDPPS